MFKSQYLYYFIFILIFCTLMLQTTLAYLIEEVDDPFSEIINIVDPRMHLPYQPKDIIKKLDFIARTEESYPKDLFVYSASELLPPRQRLSKYTYTAFHGHFVRDDYAVTCVNVAKLNKKALLKELDKNKIKKVGSIYFCRDLTQFYSCLILGQETAAPQLLPAPRLIILKRFLKNYHDPNFSYPKPNFSTKKDEIKGVEHSDL